MALLLCGWLRTCVYVWWMKDSMFIQHCTSNHAKLWAKLDDLGILNLVCQQVGTSGNLRPWREKMHDLGVVRTSCQGCRSCMVMRDLCLFVVSPLSSYSSTGRNCARLVSVDIFQLLASPMSSFSKKTCGSCAHLVSIEKGPVQF